MGKSNMAKRTPPVRPQHAKRVEALGQRLRTSRVARGMTQANLAERVGVDRTTIGKLEAGDAAISLATVLRVLSALGIEQDIDRIAAEDEVGVQLAVSRLKRPSPGRKSTSAAQRPYADSPRGTGRVGEVAEPAGDRYALRATQPPPPPGIPPAAVGRHRGKR